MIRQLVSRCLLVIVALFGIECADATRSLALASPEKDRAKQLHGQLPNSSEKQPAMVGSEGTSSDINHKWTVTHAVQPNLGVTVIAASPSGQEVASGSILSPAVSIWDVRTGALIRVLKGLKGNVQALAYSPDGRFLAVGHGMVTSSDISVHVFQAGNETVMQRLDPPRLITRDAPRGVGAVQSLHYSPDGQFLAVGFVGGAIGIYKAGTGNLQQSFRTPTAIDGPMVYSPTGKYLAISERIISEDYLFHRHLIHLIDVGTGEIVKTLSGHTDQVTALSFSPDGKSLVSGGNTGIVRGTLDKKTNQGIVQRNEDPIRIWDIGTGEIINELMGHTGAVQSLIFSNNGRTLISGSQDKTIMMWNVETGALDATLTGHHDLVDSVVVTSDRKYLVSGGGGALTFWERQP
jgi:WD40 repeat protein